MVSQNGEEKVRHTKKKRGKKEKGEDNKEEETWNYKTDPVDHIVTYLDHCRLWRQREIYNPPL